MNFDPQRWAEIEKQWVAEDADEELPALPTENVMELPTLDLSQPEASVEADTSEAAEEAGANALRLRMPDVQESPSSRSGQPATRGAGQASPPSMPSSGEQPRASSVEGLDWKSLGERMKLAEMARGSSRNYESLFANVGAQSGYRPNARAGEASVNIAKQPLDLANAQQGYEARAAALDATKAKTGAMKADNDPNSLASQKARSSLRSFFPNQKMPEGFDNWSASDVKRFADSGTLARIEQNRTTAANAAADDQRKLADAVAKKAKAGEDLEQRRKTWTPELKAAGKDPTTATDKDIEDVIGIIKAREGRAITESRDDDKEVRALSKELGDPVAFQQQYDEVMRLAKENGGEIPGLGVAEGIRQQPGLIGSAARMVSPSSDEAIKGRKLMRQLAANYARAISGAGVSDTERTNLNAATLDVDNDDSRIALAGLQTLKEMHDAKMAQLKRGYSPKAVKRATGEDETPPIPTGDPIVTLTAKDGRVKRVKKSAAEVYLKTHPGGATISE